MEPDFDALADGDGIPGFTNIPERTASWGQTKTHAMEEAVKTPGNRPAWQQQR